MTTSSAPTHADHAHQHCPGCGHSAARHSGHVDSLHMVTSTTRTKVTSTSI